MLLLKVLLDATAVPADRRGVGRYVDSIVPALAALEDTVRLQVVCRDADVEHYSELSGQAAMAAGPLAELRPTRLVWEQTQLPITVRRSGAEVLHGPHYTMPLIAGAATVVTLHDATFFSDPAVHTWTKRRFFTAATAHAIRWADGLLVPSAVTRSELCRLVSANARRANVAHLAVDPAVFHPPAAADVAALRSSLGLAADEPYLAFLGTIEPRKNIPNLIRGWAQAFAGSERPPALVIAGGSGWDDTVDRVAEQVLSEAANPALRLIRPGYLPLNSLRALLGGAEVVVYPSLGEGFGLPVLEGMACGAAVLTTRRLALPEVGGDAVAYTEVDADAIGDALAGLIADPGRRDELSSAALRRAAGFTWQAAAEVHVATYQQAAARARSDAR